MYHINYAIRYSSQSFISLAARKKNKQPECNDLSWRKTDFRIWIGEQSKRKDGGIEKEKQWIEEKNKKTQTSWCGCVEATVYDGGQQCLTRVGQGKVTTATDNAGPTDDTPGNAIQERTQ